RRACKRAGSSESAARALAPGNNSGHSPITSNNATRSIALALRPCFLIRCEARKDFNPTEGVPVVLGAKVLSHLGVFSGLQHRAAQISWSAVRRRFMQSSLGTTCHPELAAATEGSAFFAPGEESGHK